MASKDIGNPPSWISCFFMTSGSGLIDSKFVEIRYNELTLVQNRVLRYNMKRLPALNFSVKE